MTYDEISRAFGGKIPFKVRQRICAKLAEGATVRKGPPANRQKRRSDAATAKQIASHRRRLATTKRPDEKRLCRRWLAKHDSSYGAGR